MFSCCFFFYPWAYAQVSECVCMCVCVCVCAYVWVHVYTCMHECRKPLKVTKRTYWLCNNFIIPASYNNYKTNLLSQIRGRKQTTRQLWITSKCKHKNHRLGKQSTSYGKNCFWNHYSNFNIGLRTQNGRNVGLSTVQHRTRSFFHLLMDICFLLCLCLYSNKMSDQFQH